MNKILPSLLLTFSLGFCQDMSQMDQGQMQIMMQEMQKVQVCLSKIDMSALQAMQTEAVHTQNDIKLLCEKGQRDKAQKVAMSFSKRVMSMHVVSQLKECTKNSSIASMMDIKEKDYSAQHICDGKDIDLGLPSQNRINW